MPEQRSPRKARKASNPEDQSSDPLGSLLGEFSTRGQVRGAYTGAVVLIAFGLLIVWKSDDIGKKLEATGFDVIGWALVIASVCTALYGFVFLSGKSFEIRRKGVRYRTRSKTQEMSWDDLRDVNITKIETVDLNSTFNSVRTSWEIVLQSDDFSILLKEGFLNQTNNVHGLMSLLKLHCNVEPNERYVGDGNGADSLSGGSGFDSETRMMVEMAKVAKERRASEQQQESPPEKQPSAAAKSQTKRPTAGGLDLPRSAAQKLKSGMSAKDVMRWLQQKHELPPPVAEKIITKAMEYLTEAE